MTTQQAADHPGMNGYDIWAATAIERYLDHDKLSREQMVWIASALSRAPMCEVVWAEYYLSGGVIPWKGLGSDIYNEQSKRFRPFVRPWPMLTEKSRDTYFELMSKRSTRAKRSRHFDPRKGPIDPVGLLMVDDPWVLPKDVQDDPEYKKPIPPADLHGKTIEWDAPGLMKRVEHEWLVVAAAFDDRMDQELRQQDGSLSGPVPGGGIVGEDQSYDDSFDWKMVPYGAFVMGLLGIGAGWLVGYPKVGGIAGAAGGAYLGYLSAGNVLGTNYIGPHSPETSPDTTEPPFPTPDETAQAKSLASSNPSLFDWVTVDTKSASGWKTVFAMPYLKHFADMQAQAFFTGLKSLGYTQFAVWVYDCENLSKSDMDALVLSGDLGVLQRACVAVSGPLTPLSKWP